MQAIHALIAGIRGAEGGSALIYARGTTTPITWYPDFEGTGGSTATVTLDASGSAVVFVNQLARVLVRNSAGATVRDFTCGETASAVEVKSPSFNGAAYSGGAIAPGNPTDLDTVLDMWVASAGAVDFKVLYGGSTKNLSAAFQAIAGLRYFVVTAPEYGAVGDNVVDDTAAIAAANAAAIAAGGGIVYFPPGNYKVTGSIATDQSVTWEGAGPYLSYIRMKAGTYSLVSGYLPYKVSNLGIATDAAVTGSVFVAAQANQNFLLSGCRLLVTLLSGPAITASGGGGSGYPAVVRDCEISVGTGGACATGGIGLAVDMRACYVRASGAFAAAVVAAAAPLRVFDTSFTVTGSGTVNAIVNGVTLARNCVFVSGGPTVSAFRVLDTAINESGCTFSGCTPYDLPAGYETKLNLSCLGSRADGYKVASPNADPILFDGTAYATGEAQVTSTASHVGNVQVRLSRAHDGARFCMTIWNDTAGLITFQWDTGFTTTATFTVAANSKRSFSMVSRGAGAVAPSWYLVDDVAGAEVPE